MLLFIFILVSSYGLVFYFNYRTNHRLNKTIFFISLLDTAIVISLLYITFLNGYISMVLYLWFLLITLMASIYIRMFHTELQYDNYDIILEPMKNTFVLQVRTTILFVIGMTIFKYIPVYQAILYSLLIVLAGFILYYLAQKLRDFISKRFLIKWSLNGAMEVFLPIMLIMGVSIIMVFFNLPWNRLNTNLNLNPYKPTYSFMQFEPIELDYHYDLSIDTGVELSNQDKIIFEDTSSLNVPSDVEDLVIFYNESNDDTYYAFYDPNTETTHYFRIRNNVSEELLTINGRMYTSGLVIEDRIYVTSGESQRLADIYVFDLDMVQTDFIKRLPILPFFAPNTLHFETQGFTVENGTLMVYYQQSNDDQEVHYAFSIEYRDTPLEFDMYQYFSFFYIYMIGLVCFIRVSDYRKHITVIDFDEEIKKERAFG